MSLTRKRFAIAVVILLTGCLAAGVVGWVGLTYAHARHQEWYQEVECLITEFAFRRPPDVSPQQWAQCLTHTWNLHTNYGNLVYWDVKQRDAFATELRWRLRGKVGLDTIDWFWDAYAAAAPRSRPYMRYRPTLPLWMQEQPGYDLEEWTKMGSSRGCGVNHHMR